MWGFWRTIALGLLLLSGLRPAGTQGRASQNVSPGPKAPVIHATAAIVIEASTGATLYAKNPDKRLPPASTTKILTALLLARRVPPQQPIITSPTAAATPGNALGMKPGEAFTARDLLHAMLLISANDAAVAAAERMAGTPARFVAQMNAEAPKMGAPHSHFVNPNGLPDPNHYSTARDLAAIARQAMQDPNFAAAAGARTYRIPPAGRRPSRLLTNQNDLLWSVPGTEGIKTGWTRAAGYCFVGSARRKGRRIITVLLNSPNWQAETTALLNYGFACPPPSPSAGSIASSPAGAGNPRAAPVHNNALPHASHPAVSKGAPTDASAPDSAIPDSGAAPQRGGSGRPISPQDGRKALVRAQRGAHKLALSPSARSQREYGKNPVQRLSTSPGLPGLTGLGRGGTPLPNPFPLAKGQNRSEVGAFFRPQDGRPQAFQTGTSVPGRPNPGRALALAPGSGAQADTSMSGRSNPQGDGEHNDGSLQTPGETAGDPATDTQAAVPASEPPANRSPGNNARPNGSPNGPADRLPNATKRADRGNGRLAAGPETTAAPERQATLGTNKPGSAPGRDRVNWRRGGEIRWEGNLSWLWWLLGLLLLLLAWWALRRLRAGEWTMNGLSFDLSRLLGPRTGRRKDRERAEKPAGVSGTATRGMSSGPSAPPPFTFVPPTLIRRSGREWLESVLETPRLLEPAVRRQARAVLDADPRACREKVLTLLAAPSPKVRLAAADLVASHAPRRAETTLLALLEDERAPTEVQTEAIQLLAAQGGDRHEALWVQRLARESAPAAACALASLVGLSEESVTTLRSALEKPARSEKESTDKLRNDLRAAQIACVLGAHGLLDPEAAQSYLARLPDNHRDQVVTTVLDGVPSLWAADRLVETALHGHAYPALQALLDCDPALVRTALTPRLEWLDAGERTRARTLQWLILGEGEEEMIRKQAEAGDTLASGALKLARTHRCDLTQAPPDALLAAAQILSLRLGYAPYPQEQVSALFHGAASGNPDRSLLTQMPELEPLAQVYTRPEVYDAVQVALYADDGLSALLAALARQTENRSYQQELGFWSDKTAGPTRLLLAHALSAGSEPTSQAALAFRAADPCPMVRAAVLRALHAHPYSGETPESEAASERLDAEETAETEVEETPETLPPVSSLDEAA